MWFQNRRMKHKRQTLGKQSEDGDDKDSINSDGGKSGKHSDKFLDDEMSKKSCQGCEMPSAGICGAHDEIPDIGSTRGNNNNTPSATNNNTSFNNNSNGASSIGSAGSFEKMIEEDSRSNEESTVHSSPRVNKKGPATPTAVSIKTEGRRNSPNACDRKTSLSKISPNVPQKDAGMMLPTTDPVSVKMSSKAAPTAGPTLHPSPLGMNSGNNLMYPHLQRSSPATATAIASATVTIQNVPNSVPPFVARGSASNHFQNQYHMGNTPDGRNKHHQQQYTVNQTVYGATDIYNQESVGVNDGHVFGGRGQGNPGALQHGSRGELSSRMTGRNRQIYHSAYTNQQQYYYNKNHGPLNEAYGHNLNNQSSYAQGYHSEHSYNHYGYPAANMYPNDGTETMGAHVPNPLHMGHDPSSTYYSNDAMHPMHKVQNHEYQNKVAYYENSNYNSGSNQMTPNTESSNYVHSEVYPNGNTATVMATTAVMTPPASVQTDNGDSYNSYHQFYSGGENAQNPVVPTGENSNSSSDFNFLTNLANDYTPEYYQI